MDTCWPAHTSFAAVDPKGQNLHSVAAFATTVPALPATEFRRVKRAGHKITSSSSVR